MKKLCCLLLTFALLFSAAALAVDAIGEAVAQPYSAGNTLSSASRSHSYDDCIVDGAIYYLRNKSTGQYMNVTNTVDGSVVSTAAYTGSTNQKFKMIYMGKGIYEIVSVFSGTRLHIGSENELTVRTQNRGAEQKFRLHLVWSCTAVVYSQYGDATGALTWGANSSGTITRQSYSTLSDQTKGQWVFERTDTDTYESYATFYIRNVSKNLYLDVHNEATTDGMVVHGYSGLAQANQEWKMVSCPEGGCYLKSSIKRDMALDYRGDHLTIYPDNNVSTQQIFLYWEDYDVETGRDLFRIGVNTAIGIQYLTMKTQPDYATVHYYVEWSSDATDLWVFERVVVDAKDPRPLSLSTSATDLVSSTITAGYNEAKYYTFCPTKTSRYKIEFVTSYTCIFEDLISQAGDACERDRYIYRDTLIVDVFMQEGVIYYLPIKFAGTAGGADGTFTIRIRQLTFVGHSAPYDTENGIDMAIDIDRVRTYCNQMNILFNHKTNMTVAQAKASLSDFNADIFVYSGHGASGYACYEKSVFGMFDADDLPDMSNCELAVWDCCKSALPSWGDSVASKSVENGARAAVGWSDEIRAGYSEDFMDVFFRWLSLGSSVRDAARYAICEHSHFAKARTLAENLVIFGDLSCVLYPDNTNAGNMPSCNHSDHTALDLYLSNYALMVENVSLGIRVYNRMIEGIPTDDYFIEYYDDSGVVTEVHKSEYTLTEEDYASAMNQIAQLHQSNIATASVEENISYEYYFQYIAGELRLVEERISVNNMGYETCTVYDALTGEVIAYD